MPKDISYRETYGYKLAKNRHDIGLTQERFAEQVSAHIEALAQTAQRERHERITVNVELVQEWEANKKVPTDATLEAISEVLVKKLKLSGDAAHALRDELKRAAHRTREAIGAGHPRVGESWFGNVLREKLSDAGLTEEQFAAKVGRQLAAREPALPKPTGQKYDFDYVYRVEHGLAEPSAEFKDATAAVLGGTAQKYFDNVIGYLAKTAGGDLREIRHCGDTTIRALQSGDISSMRAYRAMSNGVAKDIFQKLKIIDKSGVFLQGPTQGEQYDEIIRREYDRQRGMRR